MNYKLFEVYTSKRNINIRGVTTVYSNFNLLSLNYIIPNMSAEELNPKKKLGLLQRFFYYILFPLIAIIMFVETLQIYMAEKINFKRGYNFGLNKYNPKQQNTTAAIIIIKTQGYY
ncbi:unnamed protein product [Paramecium sonneborni]|uniref:Uncharacterized protein n=1 Tax=Paramecium sonneborni TaxID=65129 RepID=A0A8S1MW01_9CILI|nr:unnamed protein product [Paramecium sonneborni]